MSGTGRVGFTDLLIEVLGEHEKHLSQALDRLERIAENLERASEALARSPRKRRRFPFF